LAGRQSGRRSDGEDIKTERKNWCDELGDFGALPREVRRRPWAGPLHRMVVWLGFELGIAPALGLSY
jgi:hypothetical protein